MTTPQQDCQNFPCLHKEVVNTEELGTSPVALTLTCYRKKPWDGIEAERLNSYHLLTPHGDILTIQAGSQSLQEE